jgi:hypothetical protein
VNLASAIVACCCIFQILLTGVARISASRRLDPCVLIAGMKIPANNSNIGIARARVF